MIYHPNGRIKINGTDFYIDGTNLAPKSSGTLSNYTLTNVSGSYTIN